jgi:RNA polymerase sigma-70 factor (ECF subfamily)
MMGQEPGKYSEKSDEELCVLFAQTSYHEVFAELTTRYRDEIFRLVLFKCRNRTLAEEAVQEAFLRLSLKAKYFQAGNANRFRSWFYSLALNCAKQTVREENRRQARENIVSRENNSPLSLPSAVDREENDSHAALSTALESLDEKLRLPVVMHFFNGLNLQEIADVIGLTPRAVSFRMEKALTKLRLKLKAKNIAPAIVTAAWLARFGDGLTAPESLSKSLRQLNVGVGAKAALAEQSARAAIGLSWAKTAAVVLLFGGLIGGTLFWRGFSTKTDRDPSAKTNLPINDAQNEAPTNALSVVWDFNDGKKPLELVPLRGEWRILPKGGQDGSDCLEIVPERTGELPEDFLTFSADGKPVAFGQDYALALLEVPVENLPIVISYRVKPQEKPQYQGLLLRPIWSQSLTHFSLYGLAPQLAVQRGSWLDVRVYLGEKAIDVWWNGKRNMLILTQRVPNALPLLLVRGKFFLDDLKIQSVKPDEIPDWSAAAAAWEAQHGPIQPLTFSAAENLEERR